MYNKFTDQLLALGAQRREPDVYCFRQEQVAVLLNQKTGIDIEYDPKKGGWFSATAVQEEVFQKACTAIRVVTAKLETDMSYDYSMFQSAVKGLLPKIECTETPEAFVAQNGDLTIRYQLQQLPHWIVEKAGSRGWGQSFREALKRLKPIEFEAAEE